MTKQNMMGGKATVKTEEDIHDLRITTIDGVTTIVINGRVMEGITHVTFTHFLGSLPEITLTKMILPMETQDENE